MSCEDCKKENKDNIPFIAHEADMSRMERTNKRLWIVIIVLIGVLLGTNGAWLWYESQFETVVETETVQTVDQDVDNGDNMFIGGDYIGSSENSH